MPKLDLSSIPLKTGSSYPAPYDAEMAGRSSQRLAQAGGLTQFGANLVTLEPGGKSSMRHWHVLEDELVMISQGELTLVTDDGETTMRPGDCATFPAGEANGHHLVNKSDARGKFLVIGTDMAGETAYYSDIDMMVSEADGVTRFTQRDGTLLKELK